MPASGASLAIPAVCIIIAAVLLVAVGAFTCILLKERLRGGMLRRSMYIVMEYIVIILSYSLIYWFLKDGGFSQPLGDGLAAFGNAVYFSFVTVTTVGYGDIYPITPFTKALAVSEVVVGMLVILLALGTVLGESEPAPPRPPSPPVD